MLSRLTSIPYIRPAGKKKKKINQMLDPGATGPSSFSRKDKLVSGFLQTAQKKVAMNNAALHAMRE